jgi:RHS repeat-associated protein
VSQVTESGGPNPSYSVNYAYDAVGNRSQTTYTSVNGTWNWLYHDYCQVGPPDQLKFGFQTLTLLDSKGNPTSEEFHYAYDSMGRLQSACFAQTPATGYTPSAGGEWYTMTEPASSRCRAVYDYDAAGRARSVYHYWENWNGSGYNEQTVLGNTCEYELSGLNRGLKVESDFYQSAGQGSSAWTLNHTETYSYDPNLDYLVGANYGDGLPNATPSWSYDAAGNRTDSVCDNLNRTVSIGGQATTCDILGNRLSLGSGIAYGWDCLNRMTSYTNNGVSNSYSYRADGMRVAKLVGSTGTTTTYAYDGQMGFEDQDTMGSGTKVTDYGIGARGIDYIASTNGGTTTVGFPLYDSHGNMTACVFRGANGAYSLGNQRSYDAWGNVREGTATGDPKGRYGAGLGHKTDDESGLVYMRARYCDASAGRFLSEDSKRNGANFLTYVGSQPLTRIDPDGHAIWEEVVFMAGYFTLGMLAPGCFTNNNPGGGLLLVLGSALCLLLMMAFTFKDTTEYLNSASKVATIQLGEDLAICYLLACIDEGD